jgi:hypothetical protein
MKLIVFVSWSRFKISASNDVHIFTLFKKLKFLNLIKKKSAIFISKFGGAYLKICEFKPKSRFCITNS